MTHRGGRRYNDAEAPLLNKQARTAPEPTGMTTSKAKATTTASVSGSSITSNITGTSSNLPYPNSTVKRTWPRGCPRTGDEITIEEVLQMDQLELPVLSSFQ